MGEKLLECAHKLVINKLQWLPSENQIAERPEFICTYPMNYEKCNTSFNFNPIINLMTLSMKLIQGSSLKSKIYLTN